MDAEGEGEGEGGAVGWSRLRFPASLVDKGQGKWTSTASWLLEDVGCDEEEEEEEGGGDLEGEVGEHGGGGRGNWWWVWMLAITGLCVEIG